MTSVFTEMSKENYIFESEYFFCIWDKYPVTDGHVLIVSKRFVVDFFSLTHDECLELLYVINKVKGLLESNMNPKGYNIGMNCGQAAGQTVMHFHCHVIPRYTGDVEDPRGGVRHCVMNKGYY
jgi:diadenosine tetraphosphate (Ap4A) HIT family hydrolase